MGDTGMDGIKILGCGHAHLKRKVTNDDFAKILDTSDEWIRTRTGIRTRYRAEQEETSDMALEAAQNALADSGIDPKRIRYFIVATLSPDHVMPSVACSLKDRLELPGNVMSFDVNAACSGFLYSLQIASGLLRENEAALVVGAEKLSKYMDWTDRNTCVLFGDGAGACVVEKRDAPLYRFANTESDLQHSLFVPGMKSHEEREIGYAQMNGREVFRFAIRAMREAIENVLAQAGDTVDDVDLVISHQANIRIIENVARHLHIPMEKMYTNLEEYGNTSAASIAIALACAKEEGVLKRGMNVVITGFGGGFSYGAVYFKW